MLNKTSKCYCIDNTGVRKVKIFNIVGNNNKREGKIGDIVWISILTRNLKVKNMHNERQRRRLRKGTIHRAVIAFTKVFFKRKDGTYIKWNENGVILIDRKKIPLGTKITKAIPNEITKKYPTIASISYWTI